MCIRDSPQSECGNEQLASNEETTRGHEATKTAGAPCVIPCLLYTSDAADERSSVDLGGRRIIKKKKTNEIVRKRSQLQ